MHTKCKMIGVHVHMSYPHCIIGLWVHLKSLRLKQQMNIESTNKQLVLYINLIWQLDLPFRQSFVSFFSTFHFKMKLQLVFFFRLIEFNVFFSVFCAKFYQLRLTRKGRLFFYVTSNGCVIRASRDTVCY